MQIHIYQDLRKETRFLPKIVCFATKDERRNRVSSRWCVSPIYVKQGDIAGVAHEIAAGVDIDCVRVRPSCD